MSESYVFITRTKGDVTVVIDSEDQIEVFTPEGGKIGHLNHRQIELPDDSEVHLITNMYMDGPGHTGAYKRQGITQECLRCLSEDFGFRMVARRIDGQTYDDGSHLTEDAPAFIQKMVKRGLVGWY